MDMNIVLDDELFCGNPQRNIVLFSQSLVDKAVKNGTARVETTDEVYYGLKVNIMYLLKDEKEMCRIEYVISPTMKL